MALLPSDYVKRLYFDSLVHSQVALSHLVEVAGADRVVLGSDYPADMGEPFPVEFVESHPALTADQRRLILGGNLEWLLAGPAAGDNPVGQEPNQPTTEASQS